MKSKTSTDESINETYVNLIPTRYHDNQEVKDAKSDELRKWKLYEAYEEVEEEGSQHVISSKWVVAEKDDVTTDKEN